MGQHHSKSASDLARNDSLLSNGTPGESEPKQSENPATVESAPAVKRKALAEPAAKKFRSLAELGTGPRGGKGGPLPALPASAPRKNSVDSQKSNSPGQMSAPVKEQENKVRANEQYDDAPALGQLPPTPEDDSTAAASVPARKVQTALGLPSNPRAKGGLISPSHVRGKSSTGFNFFKVRSPSLLSFRTRGFPVQTRSDPPGCLCSRFLLEHLTWLTLRPTGAETGSTHSGHEAGHHYTRTHALAQTEAGLVSTAGNLAPFASSTTK
jgi:hypothetical protein